MTLSKKAISPVVATALLLVVAVVAVVGFQTWFNTYQSGLNTQVEQQSQAGSAITVERLENGTLYLKNSGASDLEADVEVSATSGYSGSCDEATDEAINGSQVTQIGLTNCSLSEDSVYNVVVTTEDGVFSEEEFAR